MLFWNTKGARYIRASEFEHGSAQNIRIRSSKQMYLIQDTVLDWIKTIHLNVVGTFEGNVFHDRQIGTRGTTLLFAII
jgi:hypothetical protein